MEFSLWPSLTPVQAHACLGAPMQLRILSLSLQQQQKEDRTFEEITVFWNNAYVAFALYQVLCFTYIDSFNPSNNTVSQALLLFQF